MPKNCVEKVINTKLQLWWFRLKTWEISGSNFIKKTLKKDGEVLIKPKLPKTVRGNSCTCQSELIYFVSKCISLALFVEIILKTVWSSSFFMPLLRFEIVTSQWIVTKKWQIINVRIANSPLRRHSWNYFSPVFLSNFRIASIPKWQSLSSAADG